MEKKKYVHKDTVNWSLTKEKKGCHGARIIFSTNGGRKTGHPQNQKKKREREREKEII